MSDTWNISVGGRSYGPYTRAQMQAFVTEGRLAAHSLVARNDAEIYCPASEDDQLSRYFVATNTPSPAAGSKASAAAGAGEAIATSPSAARAQDDARGGERGRFVILADMKTGSISALVDVMQSLGETLELFPRSWLLVSGQNISSVRNALVQKLGKSDILFVVDVSRNKAAWFNFGLETDSRIRRVWSAQGDASPGRAVGG